VNIAGLDEQWVAEVLILSEFAKTGEHVYELIQRNTRLSLICAHSANRDLQPRSVVWIYVCFKITL